MKATVKKWGNSAAVRIPASVMEAMHLDLDDVVEVREEKGRIVIEPVPQKEYALEDLLKASPPGTCTRPLISDVRKATRSAEGEAVCARRLREYADQLHAAGLVTSRLDTVRRWFRVRRRTTERYQSVIVFVRRCSRTSKQVVEKKQFTDKTALGTLGDTNEFRPFKVS